MLGFTDPAVDLSAATAPPGEAAGCAETIDHTVWYRWTAPADGQLLVVTGCAAHFETVANIYAGSCGAPELEDCGQDTCVGLPELAGAPVVAGTEYRVQVGTATGVTPGVLDVALCFRGPGQQDSDGDGVPDCVDACTDRDGDGYGDGPLASRPLESCPEDNCEAVYNAQQADADLDGIGDACDEDTEPCELTLQEAADAEWVQLAGKGCYTGNCLSIALQNPGEQGCIVRVRRGDVVVSRDEAEQDMAVSRPKDLYVPAGGEVAPNDVHVACLEVEKDAPSEGLRFDVTDNLADAPGRRALAALLAVLGVEDAPSDVVLQEAVWRITDRQPRDASTDPVLVAAGLDPADLPTGGFPELENPFAGSGDPEAHYLAGLLAAAPLACDDEQELEQAASCLLDQIDATVLGISPDAIKKKQRKKLLKRSARVRKKVDAAAIQLDAKRLAKLRKQAGKRALSLERQIERWSARGKLPGAESETLRRDAGDLAALLTPG